MSVPKVCGLETEYGLLAEDSSRLGQLEAAVALVERCPVEPKVPWDPAGESPWRDARQASAPEQVAGRQNPPRPDPAAGDHPGFMLGNGARFYADHGHPEYSTPECLDALDLVASDLAGERLVERSRRHFNRFLPLGQSVRLFKNNSDHQGHSYGCHENYLMAAATYRALFAERIDDLHRHLIPFLVSRIVVCGAGKVGSENGRPPVDYQISQRADFFETLVGLGTMSRRPIVNTRDEPHADPTRYRRLHVICGDANRAQVSTYLKVGTLQLVLAMLEDGAPLPEVALADPVAAIVTISHDPSCTQAVELEDGRRLSGVELQQAVAEAAGRYLATRPIASEAHGAVLERWIWVLERLSSDPQQLATTLDWVVKWRFVDDWRRRKNLDWSAAELKELDVRYHDIDPEQGIFPLIEESTGVERLVDEARIAGAEHLAPPGRARKRARLLADEDRTARSAGWDRVVLEGSPPVLLTDLYEDERNRVWEAGVSR